MEQSLNVPEDPEPLESISPVEAIDEECDESTKANVLVYENLSGMLVSDQSSQTVYSPRSRQ